MGFRFRKRIRIIPGLWFALYFQLALLTPAQELKSNAGPGLPARAALVDKIAKLTEPPTLTNAVLKDMATAYGFWMGQNYSIDQLTKWSISGATVQDPDRCVHIQSQIQVRARQY